MQHLLVYGFRQLPRETLQPQIAAACQIAFVAADSLYLGPHATAQNGAETWRLMNNFNLLENLWFEDAARDCGTLLYIALDATPARRAEIRRQLMERFPTVRELRREQLAAHDLQVVRMA